MPNNNPQSIEHLFPWGSVHIPDVHRGYQIERKPIPPNTVNDPDFTVIRIIENFYIKDNQGNAVKSFVPPIMLHITYNMEDVWRAKGNLKKLKLAYWDSNKWVIISDPNHAYKIHSPQKGHFAEVEIDSWPEDPALAWGK
jgi:hypothetical protein